MFMDCHFAKDVWALSPNLMPLPSQTGDLYIWLLSLSPTSTKSELDPLSKALLICWQIWEARNNVVFHDSKATLASCFHAVACVSLDFWRLNSTARFDLADSMMIKWHPPPTGWIKVNSDGSLLNSHASTGFVIRDSEGHVLIAGSNNIGENSINVAECVALRDGLAAALDRGWHRMIEGDSKLVIDSIRGKVNLPWCIQQIIHDISALSSSVTSVQFQHVFREANFTADAVAKLGHGFSNEVLREHGLRLSVRTPFYFGLKALLPARLCIVIFLFLIKKI
ncbi:PREDICTED: ribonuclease [Prunus dulcis]|uniref:PREDICTED: ribonuclease n=1 Tax=Prunus dulcis TaxID=3755 RepID=A0A5E4G7T5_PRUDU|nr:PREDICTED: ribonuclease [Prunus dulcis]